MRKWIAVLIAVAVLLSSVSVVFGAEESTAVSTADSEQFQNYVDFFQAVGILEGLDEALIDAEHTLTRAEFATIIANMTGISDWEFEEIYSRFTDVDDTYWAINAIKLITELGYINGNSDGSFAPEEPISYIQAVKVLVSLLGYGPFANLQGGYPTGYLRIGQELELIDGNFQMDEALTLGTAAPILYRALNADVLITTGGEKAEYYTVPDETLLKRNLGILRAEDQILTANEHTSLSGESNLRTGEVMAGGQIYEEGTTDASQFLGYCATLYYTEDNGVYTIVYLETNANRTEVVTIQAEDIGSYQNHILTAIDENGKNKRYTVSQSADIIYNGKAADYRDTMFDLPNGTVTFLDNNRDGDYDVIFIRTFQNIVIGSIDYLNRKIYNKYPLRDGNGINIDTYSIIDVMPDSQYTYQITEQSGESLWFEDLSIGDLISVYISQDGLHKEIVRCTERISGAISELTEDTAVIGDAEYKMADYLYQTDQQLRLNEEGTFRLDVEGKIAVADFTGASVMRYGYLIDMAIEGTIDQTYRFKLLDEDGTIYNYDVDDKVILDGQSFETASILDQTFRWTEEQLREEGYVDSNGEFTIAPKTFKRQLVRYRVDKNSVIKELDTATVVNKPIDGELTQVDPNGLRAERRYKQYAKSFQLEFNISDNTKLFRVPDNGVDATTKLPVNDAGYLNDDKNFDCVDTSVFVHDRLYTVEGFDFEDGFLAGAAVIYQKGVEEVSDVSTLGLVDRITQAIDAEGEKAYKLYCLAGGKFSEYFVDEATLYMADAGGRMPMRGDVIRFSTNKNNEITSITLDLDITTLDKTQSNYKGTFMSSFYEFMGPVTGKGNGYFTVKGKKSTSADDVYLTPLTVGNFYVYDSELDRISNGSVDDLICGDSVAEGASYVLVRMGYETCKEVIIFK